MNTTPLKLLNDKDPVSQRIFLVKDKTKGIGKTGRTFLTLLIGDQSGQIEARIWDNVTELEDQFEIGDLVSIKGLIQVYNQRKQLVIHKLEKVTDVNIDKDQYKMKEKEVDAHALWSELISHVQSVEILPLKQLMLDTLQDDDIKSRLLKAPAAKSIHHAYKSGLLVHIVSICRLMNSISQHYTFLNKDLLIFGAIFHDLGKIWELDINPQQQIYYTQSGQLLGHMLLACELVEKKSQQVLGFPDDLKMILKHIILSHHGKIEYGSPKLPMVPEALVIAMIDDLDSKIDTMMNFVNLEREAGESWSRYHEGFDRYFFLEDLKTKWKS